MERWHALEIRVLGKVRAKGIVARLNNRLVFVSMVEIVRAVVPLMSIYSGVFLEVSTEAL